MLLCELVRVDKGQDLTEPRENGVLALEWVFTEEEVEHGDGRVPLRAEVCVRHRYLVHVCEQSVGQVIRRLEEVVGA